MERKSSRTVGIYEAHYSKEPFDLRLTLLRMMRNLPILVAIAFIGTLILSGVYYAKSMMLQQNAGYETVSTYQVSYVEEPSKAGDYYINHMTWNTYVHSKEFLDAVSEHLQQNRENTEANEIEQKEAITKLLDLPREEMASMILAKLDSDIHVPSTIITTENPVMTEQLAKAVEQAMTNDLVAGNALIEAIEVIDPGEYGKAVDLDIRPVRALILNAILSVFFVSIIFLIRELGSDGIWLPATLRRRYGLRAVGTIHSKELQGNLEYVFGDKRTIAVCTLREDCNPLEVVKELQEKQFETAKNEASSKEQQAVSKEYEYVPIPAPLLCPEVAEKLREAEGVLLVVPAAARVGRYLEYVLEYFETQNITVTAGMLWEADETLIRTYYMLPL